MSMITLLLIAPYKEFADQFVEIFHEHNRLCSKADYDDGDYVLKTMVAPALPDIPESGLNAEVVISRGFISEDLKRLSYFVPVVEIPVAASDLVQCVARAVRKFPCRTIAVVGASNMVMGVEKLEEIFGVPIRSFLLESTEDIPAAVTRIKELGIDTILGGVVTCQCAQSMGLDNMLLESGRESIWHSISEAKRLAYVIRREEKKSESLKAILNQSFDGVIALDQNERIQIFNNAAAKILGHLAENALGRTLAQVMPSLNGRKLPGSEDGLRPEIVRHADKLISVCGTAISVRGDSIGKVYTLQEVSRIQELESRIREKIYVRGHVAKHCFTDILGESESIRETIRTAEKYSLVDSNILITGRTGTGKELFAQSIHNNSPRRKGPFVAVNCAALSESLLESELFGYVEGAFTGASKGGKPGLFELAHCGTLFLDEISEIPPRLQGRLLRAIQEKEIMRLGHDRVIPVDVRIISATNKNLLDLVSRGSFREDLYYRLDILKLLIPDLSERKEDIPLLATHWINRFGNRSGADEFVVTEKAKHLLMESDWPGNVRQVRNVCERLAVLSQNDTIDADDVAAAMKESFHPDTDVHKADTRGAYQAEIQHYEKSMVLRALKQTGYDKVKTAKLLGVSRTTLWRRMKELELV